MLLGACGTQHEALKKTSSPSNKINLLHKFDKNLAGVIIYKNDPVNVEGDPPRMGNDHPFAVVYYFWSGSHVHDVAYDASGNIIRNNWSKRYAPISKEEWSHVDFSYGTDPQFKWHADPRK